MDDILHNTRKAQSAMLWAFFVYVKWYLLKLCSLFPRTRLGLSKMLVRIAAGRMTKMMLIVLTSFWATVLFQTVESLVRRAVFYVDHLVTFIHPVDPGRLACRDVVVQTVIHNVGHGEFSRYLFCLLEGLLSVIRDVLAEDREVIDVHAVLSGVLHFHALHLSILTFFSIYVIIRAVGSGCRRSPRWSVSRGFHALR